MTPDNHKKDLEGFTFFRLWGEEVRGGGYTQIPRMLIQDPQRLDKRLTSQHIAILTYLISRWSFNKFPFPSIEQMRKALRQGRTPLQRRINELEEWQFIRKVKRKRNDNSKKYESNQYDLNPLSQKLAEALKAPR